MINSQGHTNTAAHSAYPWVISQEEEYKEEEISQTSAGGHGSALEAKEKHHSGLKLSTDQYPLLQEEDKYWYVLNT